MSLHAIQEEFHAALLRGDAGVLTSVVAEDCRIIGPKGFFIDRDEWIRTHKDSDYQQVRLESREVERQSHGDTALRWEVQESRCVFKGQVIDGLFRVTQVWIRAEGQWRLASLQYTAISG
ncbi:nuclear transport factor 2 family protein [Streptosporangiaceae bacterium NEAU-GS5]|nr:nuclear transport factor 2 family protein [Streptosporangiaceae bacterium NEAU-GS5]